MVFAFHTLEGYLNFIGDKILPDVWEECERISIDAKLTLIFADAGSKDRPKSFTPADGDQVLELVLEQAKP